ncbi:MAG: hypothetical protein LBS25_00725, partial [Candidatus Symbiothrix sp.]|nr:hypothetical protein [Candidatus Symbiothrix sp.]
MQTTEIRLRKVIILIFFAWMELCGAFAQIQSVTQTGEIEVDCSEYQDNLTKIWNINIPTEKRLMLNYSVDTEECCDKVEIYALHAGKDSLLAVVSGQKQIGTVYSLPKNGGMRIRFTTDDNVNCRSNNTYSGFKIRIAESDSPLVLNTGGEKGIRIENSFGYMDLG